MTELVLITHWFFFTQSVKIHVQEGYFLSTVLLPCSCLCGGKIVLFSPFNSILLSEEIVGRSIHYQNKLESAGILYFLVPHFQEVHFFLLIVAETD